VTNTPLRVNSQKEMELVAGVQRGAEHDDVGRGPEGRQVAA
jgi:hypothetical protein